MIPIIADMCDLANRKNFDCNQISLDFSPNVIKSTFDLLYQWVEYKKINKKTYPVFEDRWDKRVAFRKENFKIDQKIFTSLWPFFTYFSIESRIMKDLFGDFYTTQLKQTAIVSLQEYKMFYDLFTELKRGKNRCFSEPCFLLHEKEGLVLRKDMLLNEIIKCMKVTNDSNENNRENKDEIIKNVLRIDHTLSLIQQLLSWHENDEKSSLSLEECQSMVQLTQLFSSNWSIFTNLEYCKKLFLPQQLKNNHEVIINEKRLPITFTINDKNSFFSLRKILTVSIIVCIFCYLNRENLKEFLFLNKLTHY